MISMTQKLIIQKDIQLFAKSVSICIASGLLFCGLFMLPGQFFIVLGSILIITIMLGYYPYLITTCVTREHKDKNTVFVMSLPITTGQYLFSKILSCAILYGACWIILLSTVICVFYLGGHLPALMPSYYVVMFGLFIPAFLLTLLVAILAESEGWTIVSFIFSNILVTLLVNVLPNLPAVQQAFGMGNLNDQGILWPSIFTYIALSEIIISVMLACALFIVVKTKRQFINF
ncbi:hypothetical protein TDB9533_01046 [Thalassocella blandensis]|nr:hypothetical protein TDB9533_01046 [Thalassocella blandensis]